MIQDSQRSSSGYLHCLSQLNKHFQVYNLLMENGCHGVILHFTSKQLIRFPRILEVCHDDVTSEHSFTECDLNTEHFKSFYTNVQQLGSLKVTCLENVSSDLRYFHSLEQLHLIGPYLKDVKGLRSASSHLKKLIVEKCDITLYNLLSDCCLDQSGPMSWPCLVSLKVLQCSLKFLDSALKLLPNLEELDVSLNELTSIDNEVWCLENLTQLDISFNALKLPPQLQGGVRWQLQVLILAYNELSSLEGLHVLENLKHLDISYNLLTNHRDLQPLRHLCYLEELNLVGNPLSCNKKHRLLGLKSVSPMSIKPEFILDGTPLTGEDLRSVMYTPVATTVLPAIGPNLVNINTIEPERYDVSMSSAPSAAHQQHDEKTPGSPFSHIFKQRILEKPNEIFKVTPTEDNLHLMGPSKALGVTLPEVEDENDDSLFGTPQSNGSSSVVTTLNDFESDGSFERSAKLKVEDDNVAVLAEASSTHTRCETDPRTVCHQQGLPVYDGLDYSTTSATYPECDMAVLVTEVVEEDITPPLHVKREVLESPVDILNHLPGPDEVYVSATQQNLMERDIESGRILEQLELSTVSDASLTYFKEMPVLNIKFTYLQKNRRARRYTVLDKGANDAARLLYRELKSYLLCNRSMKSQNYVCLKCSQMFQLENQNSVLDSYSLHNIPPTSGDIYGLSSAEKKVVCHCGSDMIVEKEPNLPESPLSDIDKDECEEATEATVKNDFKSLPIKIDKMAGQSILKPASQAGTSSSWINSLQAIPTVSGTFQGDLEVHRGTEQQHLSSSLPNDLSALIALKTSVNTLSHKTNQPSTPFKTFTHLLSAHDLYKLVEVTPSVNILKNTLTASCRPLDYRYCQSATPCEFLLDGRQLIATSTPRRRASLPLIDFSTSFLNVHDREMADALAHDENMKPVLNFDETMMPVMDSSTAHLSSFIEHYNWPSIQSAETGRHRFYIPRRLKHFIIEEILEAEEELCAVVSAIVIKQSGKTISLLDSKTILNLSHSSSLHCSDDFVEMDDESLASSDWQLVVNKHEVLLVLTTCNIMLLKVSDVEGMFLDPASVQCIATHKLHEVTGLELGFCNFVLYFATMDDLAVTKSAKLSAVLLGKRNQFKLSSLGQVYSAYFKASESCERFYERWMSVLDGSNIHTSKDIGTANNTINMLSCDKQHTSQTVSPGISSAYFSHALEKNFYEHVLVNLDLGTLDLVGTDDAEVAHLLTVLAEKLFVYVPCWIMEDNGKEGISAGLTVSCGGSLALVIEEHQVAMYEFAVALVDSKNAGLTKPNSTQPRSLRLTAVPHFSWPVYSIKAMKAISDVERLLCNTDKPNVLEFTFNPVKHSEEKSSWSLTFASQSTSRTIMNMVKGWSEFGNHNAKFL